MADFAQALGGEPNIPQVPLTNPQPGFFDGVKQSFAETPPELKAAALATLVGLINRAPAGNIIAGAATAAGATNQAIQKRADSERERQDKLNLQNQQQANFERKQREEEAQGESTRLTQAKDRDIKILQENALKHPDKEITPAIRASIKKNVGKEIPESVKTWRDLDVFARAEGLLEQTQPGSYLGFGYGDLGKGELAQIQATERRSRAAELGVSVDQLSQTDKAAADQRGLEKHKTQRLGSERSRLLAEYEKAELIADKKIRQATQAGILAELGDLTGAQRETPKAPLDKATTPTPAKGGASGTPVVGKKALLAGGPGSGPRILTKADIDAKARETGKTREEVIANAKKFGHTVQDK